MSFEDIDLAALSGVLPDRPLRTYPALLSTEADALAWARAGAPAGAVVVADYQASPRGRAGLPWRVEPGRGLGFSMVLRPQLPSQREGWVYTVATSALADVLGDDAHITWPDGVVVRGERLGFVGVQTDLSLLRVEWAVLTVLAAWAEPPRAPLLRALVDAVESRAQQEAEVVLAEYRPRCATLGAHVRARLIPVGPAGVVIEGVAVDCRDDGGIAIRTAAGRTAVVPPQHLGVLEVEPAAGNGSSQGSSALPDG